jgi:tetratricopeptide (TPR) repeat protein
LFKGFWDFGMGYAWLRKGDADQARAYLLKVEAAGAVDAESPTFRGHGAGALLGVAGGILKGELLRSEGRLDEATAAFEAAIEWEDGLRYDEPEPLNFSARHWLGALLLEAGMPDEAETVYRAALEDHPNNGWCLLGLARALQAQGRSAEAKAAEAAFQSAWARSDTWIRSSRF